MTVLAWETQPAVGIYSTPLLCLFCIVTGDQIVSVNGHPVMGKSYSQVIELILSRCDLLELHFFNATCLLNPLSPNVHMQIFQTDLYLPLCGVLR